MGDSNSTAGLLNSNKKHSYSRIESNDYDELQSFRRWLKWMCVDQSNWWTAFLSWFVFVLLALVVPCLSHFFLACSSCDSQHTRPYDAVVQVSLTGVAVLSFVCLTRFLSNYGLRRFLFFDKLYAESETVRKEYTVQLTRSVKIILIFVIPCFGAEIAYKIWWYTSGGTCNIPFLGNVFVSDIVACILELCSWLYRTTVFFLVCVLFRLICYLQILRLQDFAQVFQDNSDVASVLSEHLRIRRQLMIISHRYRVFILWALILVTASLFASLLITTRPNADLNIYMSGELALCSVSLLAGLMILLRCATRITHKAQSLSCLAAKWHVCATIDSFESETPVDGVNQAPCRDGSDGEEDVGDEEDEIDNTKIIPSYAYSTISFQNRQALLTYFENNRAGITIYGFVVDRSTIHSIFGIELGLVLWLLGKTIGIS